MLKHAVIASLFICLSLSAAELTGTVVYVFDGDTITVRDEAGNKHRVRLYGIDAPETRQTYGYEAKKALFAMLFRETVTVSYKYKDRYGRIIGKIIHEGENINAEMILRGSAWHYCKYAPKDILLKESETAARGLELGLWGDSEPVPPWQYRKQTAKIEAEK